jgi:hypothetical protein
MKRIKNYQDFTNEELNWKKALAGAAIVASLNLTSCDTQKDIENKIPQVEILVKNQIDRENSLKEDGDTIIFNGISEIKEFKYKSLETNAEIKFYFIISKVTEYEGNSMINLYWINVYEEDQKTKSGKITSQFTAEGEKELENNLLYHTTFKNVPRRYSEYLDIIERNEDFLKDMKKDYKDNPHRGLPLRDYDGTDFYGRKKTYRFGYEGNNINLFSIDENGKTLMELRVDFMLKELEFLLKNGSINKEQYDEIYNRATKLKSDLANF